MFLFLVFVFCFLLGVRYEDMLKLNQLEYGPQALALLPYHLQEDRK